jgi:hypothetical protein
MALPGCGILTLEKSSRYCKLIFCKFLKEIEYRGQVLEISASWEVLGSHVNRMKAILTKALCDIPQSLRANSGIASYVRVRSLLSASFSTRYALFFLSFDGT